MYKYLVIEEKQTAMRNGATQHHPQVGHTE